MFKINRIKRWFRLFPFEQLIIDRNEKKPGFVQWLLHIHEYAWTEDTHVFGCSICGDVVMWWDGKKMREPKKLIHWFSDFFVKYSINIAITKRWMGKSPGYVKRNREMNKEVDVVK